MCGATLASGCACTRNLINTKLYFFIFAIAIELLINFLSSPDYCFIFVLRHNLKNEKGMCTNSITPSSQELGLAFTRPQPSPPHLNKSAMKDLMPPHKHEGNWRPVLMPFRHYIYIWISSESLSYLLLHRVEELMESTCMENQSK